MSVALTNPAPAPSALAAGRAELGEAEFRRIAEFLHKETGITLARSKMDLVQGRLTRRLRALRISSFAEYVDLIGNDDAGEERRQLINALTTNLTSFFREAHHFDYLGDTILRDVAARSRAGGRLRIWSAGCSSGEEPYSIAMTLSARLPELARWDARILATDIDTNMVATGLAGRYEAARAEGIPDSFRKRFVAQSGDGAYVQMSDAIRNLIAFRQLNLLGPWPMRGPFDAIFCRNVVIYFDKPTQRALFDRFADILAPGGWLFVGHSETLFRLSDRFESCGRTIYRKTS